MNKVFLDLLPEESRTVEVILAETEQIHWTIEKNDTKCQLCGYFEDDFQNSWGNLQKQIPLLADKTLIREMIHDCDWQNEYKKYLQPFNVGPLHVVPVWERKNYSVPENHFAIYLDAEMAFGTGAHETTKLCLARIVEYRNLFSKDLFLKKVIDVGCGSGILSIAAAKLGFKAVYGFDIDPDAVRISEKNALENDVSTIEFKVAGINEGILGHQADLILANVLAPVLIAHASVLVNTVKKYGALSLSGILAEEVAAVNAAFTPLVKRHWDSFFTNTKSLGQWSEIAYVRT
ncbi:MAG: 50S ribosomal protein L11 methyltransferase [Puniceicoccales bacterium]|jgi:ribosomal protein L11 methyltransferase|nr:50S ribosomal protein L11 methyltransferase [Puniceicoccales bacterium]